MSFPFNITNPGIFIDGLLTSAEREFVTDLYTAGGLATEGDVLTWTSGAPSWEAPTGGGGVGDVVKVGTPVNNQVGVWTGDGTIEGDTALTFDTTSNTFVVAGEVNAASVIVTGATANRIASFGASKQLEILSTATYPSLTELSYVKGVTSAIQTQIDGKAASSHTHTVAQITDLTASAAELNILDGATLTVTELNYVDGVTSAIQTQLDAKQAADAQLTSLAGLSFTGNSLKVVRVNAGETDFELATISAGGGDVTKVGTPVNNQIGVWTGDGTIEGDADFTWSGTQLDIAGSQTITVADATNVVGLTINQNDVTNDPLALKVTSPATDYNAVQVESTSVGAWGPHIEFFHNSASPAASDFGGFAYYANNDAATKTYFGGFSWALSDPTAASEDSFSYFITKTAGSNTTKLEVGRSLNQGIINGISIGDSGASGVLSSRGNQDLILQTGNATTGSITIADGANGDITIAPNGTGDVIIGGADLKPDANDGGALGEAATSWSDLFLAEGGVINWDNGDATLTQAGNQLSLAGANFRVGAGSFVDIGSAQVWVSDGVSDLTIGPSNIQVNGVNAKRSLVLTASGGNPTTTSGCASPVKVEAGTNDIDYYVLDFDTTTEERAFWNVVMPDNWDGGTVTAQFYWTNASGSSTQTVAWGIKARAFADDAAIDQAYGTEVTTTDTWLAQGDVHISAVSSAITVGGSPAGGQYVVFNVGRKVASDNMTGDARLLSVRIEYGINAYSE